MHKAPTDREPQIYGGYSAGCMDGGVAMPLRGKGYQMVRLKRNRYYGQPSLVNFLKEYSKKMRAQGMGRVLIADMAQPRGGPMLSGHASHQIGLDADIYFDRIPKNKFLVGEETETIEPKSRINANAEKVSLAWSPDDVLALKTASLDPMVERIFIHYILKRDICARHKGEEWLSKLRPWWGHHYHYHVRLKCPEGQEFCRGQKPPEPTDGCDENLAWWFSEEAKEEASKKSPKKDIVLPAQCEAVASHENG